MSNQPYCVEMVNISKSFGGVQALNNVSLQIRPGEIHALVGRTGGKVYTDKNIGGAYREDSVKSE